MNTSTPRLMIDAVRVEKNLNRLAAYGKSHNLDIRPHTKTHKSLKLARMQLQAGAIGLTVAKVGEANIMAEICDDVLVAYPTVDAWRCKQIAQLAQKQKITVALDSDIAVESLSHAAKKYGCTIGVLVDMDVGFHRTGVQTALAAVELAQKIDKAPGLRPDGLFCFPGQVWELPENQGPVLAEISSKLAEALDLFSRHGLPAPMVSGGSTPSAFQSHLVPEFTEIRPGTYIFNDMNTVRGGFCELDDCAATILTTVVSDAVPGQVVVDAGSKTLTSDRCGPEPQSGYGYILEYPEAKITALSEEHGQVEVRTCDHVPTVGERVTIIPNHICPCVNLQDYAWWVETDRPPEPLRIDARGKVA